MSASRKHTCRALIIVQGKRDPTDFGCESFYGAWNVIVLSRATFAQTRSVSDCPRIGMIGIFLQISHHILQLLILIFQFLYPLILL